MTIEHDAEPARDLAARFSQIRPRLYGIAYRALGSPWSADDALQEVWLRLQRAPRDIDNLEAWLTTVTSRVCIDMIRQQARWREWSLDDTDPRDESVDSAPSPLDAAIRTDDLALAMQVMLDTLGPLERLALVLHDVFALPFDDIAPIVERTPQAARQLASRARARLRKLHVHRIRVEHTEAVEAFLGAARSGDFGALLRILDPDIAVRSDETAVATTAAGAGDGAPMLAERMHGADAVSRAFAGRATLVASAVIGGIPAAVYANSDAILALYLFTMRNRRVVGVDVLADPARIAGITLNERLRYTPHQPPA